MNNLLKITTKPIKISVQVEKGKFVKVEKVIRLQKVQNKSINSSKYQTSYVHSQKVQEIEILPNNIKLNQTNNNISNYIQKNITQSESKNVTYLPQNSNAAKIEPIQEDSELKYEPSDLNFVVSQYSEIKFEYIGDPIYIPENANPNKEK